MMSARTLTDTALPDPRVVHLKRQVSTLRAQLQSSLDARERLLELVDRHEQARHEAEQANLLLRTALDAANDGWSHARDELATERAEHYAARETIKRITTRNVDLIRELRGNA